MRRDLDIRPLRTLVTIVDTGGFRRAAENLNMSQPAVSQHIRRLEGIVGEPIFREKGQQLKLSAIGEELLRHARQLVHANDELVLHLGARQSGNRMSLGVCEALAGIAPDLLGEFHEHIPPPRLRMYTGPRAELSARLGEGNMDAILSVGYPVTPADQVIGHVAFRWFGNVHLLERESLPIAVYASRSGPLRQLVENTLAGTSVPWHVIYEGICAQDIVAVSRLGIGASLLFAVAERLWGLPLLPAGYLPEPDSLPVTLTTGPRLARDLAQITLAAAGKVMREYMIEPHDGPSVPRVE